MSKIFVVEDEALIAMLIEDMLEELGHQVVASAQRLDEALAVAQTVECDLAILDINLNGKMSSPVAALLQDREIPFFFASGYGRSGLKEQFANNAVLPKPFGIQNLSGEIQKLLAAPARDVV